MAHYPESRVFWAVFVLAAGGWFLHCTRLEGTFFFFFWKLQKVPYLAELYGSEGTLKFYRILSKRREFKT